MIYGELGSRLPMQERLRLFARSLRSLVASLGGWTSCTIASAPPWQLGHQLLPYALGCADTG